MLNRLCKVDKNIIKNALKKRKMERILTSIDDTNRKPLSFTEWMNKHIPVVSPSMQNSDLN